jgi:hypothetical protein
MLLLPGQTNETWEPSDKKCSITNREKLDREALLHLFFPQPCTRITEGAPKTAAFNTRTKNLAMGLSRGRVARKEGMTERQLMANLTVESV